MKSRKDILASISDRVFDFRIDELRYISEEHIDRWVKQFDEEVQLVILQEMDHILSKYFLTQEEAKTNLKSFLMSAEISGDNPQKSLRKINFLNIQTKGSSQRDLLRLADEILEEEFNLRLYRCGGSNKYVYLDDCVYTGNRLRYDLVPWIEQQKADKKIELYTYHFAIHLEGIKYAWKHITNAANKKGLFVAGHLDVLINNSRKNDQSPDVLWPHHDIQDENIRYYYQKIIEECENKNWSEKSFRDIDFQKETLFTSSYARKVVEHAFLKEGVKLILDADNPSESLRPLGFEKLPSMGFGSVFVTYRNISNNCPLVLWYGDPEKTTGPLSKWFPLFNRKTNRYDWYY